MLFGHGCPIGRAGQGRRGVGYERTNRAGGARRPPTRTAAKRRQIIDGARQVFMAQGFDAASMGDIARVAGVSKGTLYVYFKSKEELFEAIVQQECRANAEQIFDLDRRRSRRRRRADAARHRLCQFLCRPGRASPLRTVIAIAERMPEIGRQFYESGPAFGIAQLEGYLRAQVAAGVLVVEDCEVAAAQFLDACLADRVQAGAVQFRRCHRRRSASSMW